MDKAVTKFLNTHRVSVLGILQKNNAIHSASLHFAYSKDTNSFYFITAKSTRKCESLINNETQNASLVIGFSEEEFATFQAEGKVKIVTRNDEDTAWNTYLRKYPEREAKKKDKSYVILEFKPGTWKFTNMKEDPAIKISSED